MKLICASSVTLGQEAFSPLGDVAWVPETDITPDMVKHADAVITRTKTKLTRGLFEGSSVRFVGTCTAGTDHADLPALRDLGVAFASAPGCNANAVSEYVVAALLESGFGFQGKVVGIVGHGQVGTRVDHKLTALGCTVLRNDPPKEATGGEGSFTDLEELLERSDVVTLHVPLVEDGPHPTRNLLNPERMAILKPGAILLNACRGEAVDNQAVIRARKTGRLSWLTLDVWDPEPEVPMELLDAADLGTAHIAGHSVEGKVNGTRQIREALVAHFNLDVPAWDPTPLLPAPAHPQVDLSSQVFKLERLHQAVSACYDIRHDDALLRQPVENRGALFTTLRRAYRDRREFTATRVTGLPPGEHDLYRKMGFQID